MPVFSPARLAACGLLLLIGAGLGGPAIAGDSGLGIYKGRPVRELHVEGRPEGVGDGLRQGLALRPRGSWWRRQRPTFFPELLEQDLLRARIWMARQGYPYARPQARLASPDGETVEIWIDLHAGTPVRARRVTLLGLEGTGLPTPSLRLREGLPVRDREVETARLGLREGLLERGHLHARVTSRLDRVDSLTVDVTLEATPGPVFRTGEVAVLGIREDLQALAREASDLPPGTLATPSRLREAEENLRMLRLFRRIHGSTEPVDSTRVDVRWELVERQHRTLQSGIGYWSDDGLRLAASWEHRNLFAGGRGARVGSSYSRYLQTLRTSVWWPALLSPRTQGLGSVLLEREDEEGYRQLELSLELMAQHRFDRGLRLQGGGRLSFVDLELHDATSLERDEPNGHIVSVFAAFTRDRSDHPLYPTSGSILQFTSDWTPPDLGSVAHYLRGSAEGIHYQPLGGGVVLGSRLLLGAGAGQGESETLLVSQRFFAGGSRSMRGFKRRRLGPTDADGDPVGGEAKLESSLELRFPLLGRLAGAVFVDAGQVWKRRGDLQPFDLEWAVGPGLRVRTPVGPIRADLGQRLGPRDDEPRRVFHLSIGATF